MLKELVSFDITYKSENHMLVIQTEAIFIGKILLHPHNTRTFIFTTKTMTLDFEKCKSCQVYWNKNKNKNKQCY